LSACFGELEEFIFSATPDFVALTVFRAGFFKTMINGGHRERVLQMYVDLQAAYATDTAILARATRAVKSMAKAAQKTKPQGSSVPTASAKAKDASPPPDNATDAKSQTVRSKANKSKTRLA
jgi:hypothetical protein